jgi:hypothetical protein
MQLTQGKTRVVARPATRRERRVDTPLTVFTGFAVTLHCITFFFNFGRHSELFCWRFSGEFLESGIGAQWVPNWIEPKKGWRDRSWEVKQA